MKMFDPLTAGEYAFELFMSSEPFPLHKLLDDWKEGKIVTTNNIPVATGYILAVIGVYRGMVAQCGDGRYKGKIRKG